MQPSLFDWIPPCKVIVFPMGKRIGRIRSTAEKMLAKSTDRAAASYRDQVTDALLRSLIRTGIPGHERDEQLSVFWSAVQAEIIRLTYRGNHTGDAA